MATKNIQIGNVEIHVDVMRDHLAAPLAAAVGALVEGASKDVQIVATDIARNLAEAQTVADDAARQALIVELQGQVAMLAELNRLRLSAHAQEVLRSTVAVVGGTVSAVLAAVGQGLAAAAVAGVTKAMGATGTSGPSDPIVTTKP